MNGFQNQLKAEEIGESSGRTVWKLLADLVFILGNRKFIIPAGFETDFASVPRVPIAYMLWGDRAHREAVLHDYCYRKDAVIYDAAREMKIILFREIPKEDADWMFRAAMISRGQPYYIYQPMYMAVRLCGGSSFHRMNIADHFPLDKEETCSIRTNS